MIPGEIIFGDDQITCNADKEAVALTVLNSGDRPVQVGSHFHFFEANDALQFDRASAWGKRLDIAAGTAVRFEAGQTITVNLIDMGGKRRVFGFNGKVNGYLDAEGVRPAHADGSAVAPAAGADAASSSRSVAVEVAKASAGKGARPAQVPAHAGGSASVSASASDPASTFASAPASAGKRPSRSQR